MVIASLLTCFSGLYVYFLVAFYVVLTCFSLIISFAFRLTIIMESSNYGNFLLFFPLCSYFYLLLNSLLIFIYSP